MNHEEYWERFTKTGNVYDYLSYTACTIEQSIGYEIETHKEGGNTDYNRIDRDGIVCHADW